MIWVLLWVACGYLSYGLGYAHFQRTYPELAKQNRESDYQFCVRMGLLGPLNLFVILMGGYWRKGFLTRRMQRKQEEASGS